MELYFTDGRVQVHGGKAKRATGKKADYLLFWSSNQPLAIVEAKKYDTMTGDGMDQALDYAQTLDVPFAYTSNGKNFLEHDLLTGKERTLSMEEFPSPEDLWQRFRQARAYTPEEEELIQQPYYFADNVNSPRYYQRIAINRTVEAVARGQQRILLVMATGTGKTYTAFQIIHRLWKSGRKKRILFLADRNVLINSISEFKQIIGRGTRLRPDCDKWYFTIMDFRNVCRLFSDPDFDGDPIPVDDDGGQPGGKTTPDTGSTDGKGKGDEQKKVIPRVNGVEVRVLNERVQYYDKDGKLITGSITDYSRRNILQRYATLDAFLHAWDAEERKATIVEELENQGVLLSELREAAGDPAIDDFDLICHVAFDKPPLTRAERVRNVRKGGYLHKYSDQARAVIEALLDKYKDSGITQLEDLRVLQVEPFSAMDSPMNLARRFGGRDQFLQALHELRSRLYTVA